MNEIQTVRYRDRSREYYAAQGYEKAYEWSHYEDVPFTPLKKPLNESTVTIVTTAMPNESYAQERRRLFVGDFDQAPNKFFTGGLSWDKDATHTDDIDTYFPLAELSERISAGSIGGLAPHYYCIPTLYSQSRTLRRDAPAIVQSCLDNAVDVALLVPL